jgi:Ca-activated chloride channel family protein
MIRRRWFLPWLLGALWAVGGVAEERALYVTLTSPAPGTPLFGEAVVEARVEPAEAVDTLDFFVDGEFITRLRRSPFRVTVDVGQDNAEHRFEVVARGEGWGPGQALLVTPAVPVDAEVELRLQQLYVTVERGDRRVLNLGRESFAVFDGGIPQELVTFERGGVPLTAVLLIDASSSMRGRPLAAARRGARAFLAGTRSLDLTKLMLFSDSVLHNTPFTGFAGVLGAGLDAVEARGGTALNDHLYLALRHLGERQGRRVLVLLSDGIEVASVLDIEDVRWLARRNQAQIYWIRLGNRVRGFRTSWRGEEDNRRQVEGLEAMVRESGGRILPIEGIGAIEAAFARVMAELRQQYVLGYYPSESRGDGSWRQVLIRLDSPGLEARTRTGYIDR